MLALLLATTLSLTLPQFNRTVADSLGDRCEAGGIPLHDLWRLQLYGCPAYIGRPWTPADTLRCLIDVEVSGREGEPVQIVFDDAGKTWTLFAVTLDHNLNRSCRSNQVGVGPGMGPGKVYPGAEPPERP